MKRKYRSRIAGFVHEDMEDAYMVGAISDERMDEWDRMCVTKTFRESVKADRERRLEEEWRAQAQNTPSGALQKGSNMAQRKEGEVRSA